MHEQNVRVLAEMNFGAHDAAADRDEAAGGRLRHGVVVQRYTW